MKSILLLTLCAIAATTWALEENERIDGENGWYIPKIDGTTEWVDMEEVEATLKLLEEREQSSITNPVKFYLYTASNPRRAVRITDSDKSISESNFNPANPTRIVIHGFIQGRTAGMNRDIRNAWLKHGDHNIIIVDWARARAVDYISSVVAVPTTGRIVANMIDHLVKNHDMNLDDLIVAGFSLGAHVAGHAGKNIETGTIKTIIGLDPASPLFKYNSPDTRLTTGDAYYVETIRTSVARLGLLEEIGNSSFYVNGGISQPGCGLDLISYCAHNRSPTYYAEAVELNNFGTIKCDNYQDAVNDNCGDEFSSVHMGDPDNAGKVNGAFYVPVNRRSPYGVN